MAYPYRIKPTEELSDLKALVKEQKAKISKLQEELAKQSEQNTSLNKECQIWFNQVKELEGKPPSEKNYLDKLPKAKPITLLQMQNTLHPCTWVSIKPCNHKTYYSGDAQFIPKDMYDWEIIDIILLKKGNIEEEPHGSIAFYVNHNEKYDRITDEEELREINCHYRYDNLINDFINEDKSDVYSD